jgi:hypothetical protein
MVVAVPLDRAQVSGLTTALDMLVASAPPGERRIIEEFKAAKLAFEERWSAAALREGYDERLWHARAVKLEAEYRQRIATVRGGGP